MSPYDSVAKAIPSRKQCGAILEDRHRIVEQSPTAPLLNSILLLSSLNACSYWKNYEKRRPPRVPTSHIFIHTTHTNDASQQA
jgi:hypothetical protein